MTRHEVGGGNARAHEEHRAPGVDLRCGCHRLLARAVVAGIELRCARCKSTQVLAWSHVRALEMQLSADLPLAAE